MSTESHLNEYRPLNSVIRRAAKSLAPVIVDLGPGHPKLASFLDSIRKTENGPQILLFPIVADVIPPIETQEKVHVRSTDPANPWSLEAPIIQPIGGNIAYIELSKAHITTMPKRLLARGGISNNEPMVLVVRGVTTQFEANAFPVLDLTPHHCAIESALPFELGTEFDPIELYGARRMLRRVAATVEECMTWYNADGTVRYRCMFALTKSETSAPAYSYDLVSDPSKMQRILQFMGKVRAFGWYVARGWGQGTVILSSVDDTKVMLQIDAIPAANIEPPAFIRVGFELLSVCYEMDVHFVRKHENLVEVGLPLVLRRRRQRQAERIPVPEKANVSIRYSNPVTGQTLSRKVSDISFGGICFSSDEAEDVVWEDLALERAELIWNKRKVDLGDLEVRSLENGEKTSLLCHTAFRAPHASEDRVLVDLIATLKHPQLEIYGGDDFNELYSFYERVGLISPFMKRNLSPDAPKTWKRLFGGGRDIARALVHRDGVEIDAAISAVRPWEKTWVLQHYGAIGKSGSRWSGDLYVGMAEYLIPRTDGNYIFFFILPSSSSNSFYERFVSLTGTSETFVRSSLYYWVIPPGRYPSAPQEPELRVRPLRKRDELLVSRAAERCLGTLTAKAMSIQPGQFHVTDTRNRFKLAGLCRERQWHIITRSGIPAIAVVHENTSPGVNLTWKLNASWIIPIHPDLDRDGAATRLALAEVTRRPIATPAGDRFLFVTSLTDKNIVANAGYSLIYNTDACVLNRAGLQRLYYYAKGRFGEAGMRAEARNSLRRDNNYLSR